jgi:hypothetical protein
VFLPCQGGALSVATVDAGLANMVAYTNAGGRVFATHYSDEWLDTTFAATAHWDLVDTHIADQGSTPSSEPGFINTGFAKGQALAQWLQIVGASTTYGEIPVSVLRQDLDYVNAPAELWMWGFTSTTPPTSTPGSYTKNLQFPFYYAFNTPFEAPDSGVTAQQECGRVLFDDFHVEDTSTDVTYLKTYPYECQADGGPSAAMTPQERLLEFMIFDLSSCITTTTPTPPTCQAVSCATQHLHCGPAGDGCGNEIDGGCGVCTPPETCGGGGTPGVCGGTTCTKNTCAKQGIQCGPAGDGCGDLIQCGNCPNGETCGGGGVPGKCGAPVCPPITCAEQHIQCGPAGNGCGGLLSCGKCPPGETCGGGGVPGVCGVPDGGACPTLTCTEQNIGCGPAGDGCGGQLYCGPCPPGETCGGGGQPGQCGAGKCTPTTCTTLGIECGPAGDGCGGEIQCGTCPPNEVCGGCGTPGVCGSCCVPTTCTALGYNCGPAGDGCGGIIQCGTCTAPDTCGGGGVAGVCGHRVVVH